MGLDPDDITFNIPESNLYSSFRSLFDSWGNDLYLEKTSLHNLPHIRVQELTGESRSVLIPQNDLNFDKVKQIFEAAKSNNFLGIPQSSPIDQASSLIDTRTKTPVLGSIGVYALIGLAAYVGLKWLK
jgi:hypothetical protein